MRWGVKLGARAWRVIGVSGAVFALIVGCGTERPPPAGDPSFTIPSAGASGGGLLGDAGSNKPPGCGQKADGTFCDCNDTPLFTDPPNMYFILDRSGSMAEDNKWTQVRIVVSDITRGLGPRATFGATLFPGVSNFACGDAVQVLPLTQGDPIGAVDGPVTKTLLMATEDDPGGGTPTAAALRSVLPTLKAASATAKTFAILATDGAPNCNMAAICSVADCQPNIDDVPGCPSAGPSCCEQPNGDGTSCNDAVPTLSAVTALKASGVPVFIIGLPGSATYSSLLDQLAVAGGTALPTSPKYYRVDSTANPAPLLASLKQIAAKIVATCEFTLKATPKDPGLVNVYLDEVVLPQDPTNGWKIDGAMVTLLGTACARVLDGDVFDVRIITGCPTIGPR
jgi:hypothetical protein